MAEYIPTIGLEVHAELKTRTKMFCDSKNDPDETCPNVNVCPVCMAHPGTLPVINKEAVKHIVKIGKAVGGAVADFTEFDRKNYFYPDIPKGYQISQYEHPIVLGGTLDGVALTRVHLEEDTASSSHETGDYSLVDFNRAGVPLMELVTEPVIKSAKQAGHFARELQLLLRTLGVSEANMEKGEMRVEANVSVAQEGARGTKVEIKNLNSFKSVERAIEYEIARQSAALEKGERIVQETRGWDENAGKTFSQRLKETSQDYRYFPDPDLPKLWLSKISDFQNMALPELPWQKRERYAKVYGIKSEDIEAYVTDEALGGFFEGVMAVLGEDRAFAVLASNYITSDLVGLMKTSGTGLGILKPESFALLMRMARDGAVSSRGAKDILAVLFVSGGDPKQVAEEKGLLQQSDEGALKAVVQKIISEHQKVADEYKNGKESALQFFIGQGMKETKGSANPAVLKKIFIELLK
ncbi:MAG: Asp-tRNA(Asn)/Glu-tRNA(Gln) amidotransferase subunit GatB [Candidatus Lloydbacteria bacterium]|nr:Asp-tRNA(Asn)/Glu-tRNA(Gln) amidotransferase subunit GatB [Candidatus Lloydbacteria bacterium]